jgi:hypothetical protein
MTKLKPDRVWFNSSRYAPAGMSWHKGLQCYVKAIEYRPADRLGVLEMDSDSCCDMAGCIALFEAIDPEVENIVTRAGESPDTSYRRKAGRWQAVTSDGGLMS